MGWKVDRQTARDRFRWSGKRVLVTGASGFIGHWLCRRLHQLGAEVHGVSRQARRGGPVTRWWQASLEDADSVHRLIADAAPQVVFHLASFVSGSRAMQHVLPAFQANALSTVNLLVSCTQAKCERIVLTGSLEEAEGDVTVATPGSPYAAAKTASSAYARMFHALYGTPVTTARLFMTYGPGQPDDTKLVPYVTRSLLAGRTPELSSGTRLIDWVYVDDVVDAYLALASRPGVEGLTIDVGTGELTPIREVVESLAAIIGPNAKLAFGAVGDRPLERVRVADTQQAHAVSGWRAKTSLQQGLRATVEWYRARLHSRAKRSSHPPTN